MADGKKISDAFLSLLDSVQPNKTVHNEKTQDEARDGLNRVFLKNKGKQSNKHDKKPVFDQKLDESLEKKDFSKKNCNRGKRKTHSNTQKKEPQNINDSERPHTSSENHWKRQFPTQKQVQEGNKSHLSNESVKGSGRFPVKNEKPHNKEMGYKFLESLLEKEPRFVVTKLACPRSGFHELVNNRPIRPDLLILIVSALCIVNESEFDQLKMQILRDTIQQEFIDEIKKYVGCICIEDNLKRLKSLETFYKNILDLFESIINYFPSLMNDRFKSTVVALSLSMRNAKQEQKVTVSDCLFEQLKCIDEQVSSYIENNKKNEIESKQSSNVGREILAPNNFRDLPIVPTVDDFMNDKPFLRRNIVKGAYNDCEQYIDTQFRLLREDFVAPLRSGIYEYIETLNAPRSKRKYSNVKIYPKVKFIEPCKRGDCFGFLVSFDCDRKLPRNMNWEFNKRFIFGSLLLFSDNHFETFYLATVSSRDTKDLQNGVVFVSFVPGTDTPAYLFEPGVFFVMAESEVYYEAYRHVLSALKRLNQKNFPMKEYIVDVKTSPSPPDYVLKKLVYELSTFKVSILEEDKWPTPDQMKLNPSQHNAFKNALTNKFSVIQGPPGTGKTFLALKITEVLLKNEVSTKTPIVVICYTNHALDQFLEGILKYTQNLIRIGSQSQNESLTEFNLNEVKKKTKNIDRRVSSSPLFRQTTWEKFEIQRNLQSITSKIEELNSFKGILDLSVLKSVITPQQLDFLKGQEVDWLTFKDIPDQVCKSNEVIFDNMTPVGLVSEIHQDSEVFENMTEYHDGYDGQIDEDENARRLADMLDYDYVDDCYDVINEGYSSGIVQYKIDIKDVLMKVNELKQELLICSLPYPQNLYFKQDTNFTIHELQLLVDFLRTQFSKFKDMKFDHRKFEILQSCTNVWEICPQDRWELYITWINLYCCQLKQTIQHLSKRYQAVLEQLHELRQLEDLLLVVNADVIGLTTSGAARLRVLLESLEPKIVIVEEAAEVLEAHVVTSLTKSVQHVILIGDHKQLKPNPAVYHLAKKYNMDISLFERMLNNGMGCSILDVQHRMRPEIASLITPTIYPTLYNHPTTLERNKILGIDKFVFFLTHNIFEDQLQETSSKQNQFESDFLMKLCQYLVHQGYKQQEITVLSPYAGQVWLMRQEKRRLSAENKDWRDLRITPVDNYQGEENRIILLSLVRSNKEAKIGFSGVENRVCVALSRARDGLYIVGNMDNLTASSSIWPKVKEQLEEINAVGRHLVLRCERHPHQVTPVSCAKDFSAVPDGGCSLMCQFELTCGHICPRVCHIIDLKHEFFKCEMPCERPPCEEEGHRCPLKCFQTCLPCAVPIKKQLPCDHWAKLPCHQEPATASCRETVTVTLPDCGHTVQKFCYEDINNCQCTHPCAYRLPCGHACERKCHIKKDPDHIEYKCNKDCPRPNVKCRRNHPCPKRCYEDCGNCSVKMLVKLTCGHRVKIECSEDDSTVQCDKPCTKQLKCGHKCPLVCCLPCELATCKEKVNKEGTCGHIFKNVVCSESTDDQKCFCPCSKFLACGHSCKAKCFQDCSKELCQELVETKVGLACNHPAVKIPCHINKPDLNPGSDELVQLCQEPCAELMTCGHRCTSTCGRCLTGRLHAPCRKKCNKQLICGHWCKSDCNVLCPPCLSDDCFQNCTHFKCNKRHPCNKFCQTCTRPCVWECVHYKCTKQCGEECNRPVCDEPCQYELRCGHLCIGYCGEVHPLLCRFCDHDNFIIAANPHSRFVLLEDCGHVIESTVLDGNIAAVTVAGVERLLECPQCSKPIVKTNRYRKIYIRFQKQKNLINQSVHEEMQRLRQICSTNIDLFRSEPTSSPYMNILLSDCCSHDKNVKATMAKYVLMCLLQPLVELCNQHRRVARLEGLSIKVNPLQPLRGEQEQRLRLRLEYLASALRPRINQISYQDIKQIELEVARVLRAVSSPELNLWFDTSKYTWEKDRNIVKTSYNLKTFEKFSSTLKTRNFEKQWYLCSNKHLYVCENGEPCVTCIEEVKRVEIKRIQAEQSDQSNRNTQPILEIDRGNYLIRAPITDYRVRGGRRRGRGKGQFRGRW